MNQNPRTNSTDQFLERLKSARAIAVVGHLRPDGDCVGSQLAMAYALDQLGKEVTVWNQDPMPRNFLFLDPNRRFKAPVADRRRFDLVVSTDCASYKRLGAVTEAIENRDFLFNVDHHASNPGYGDENWIEEERSSTGEILWDLFERFGWDIDSRIADCLYAAISTDTGSFQFPTTTPETLRIAAKLVERGADLEAVSRHAYHSNSEPHMSLLRHVYGTYATQRNGSVAYFMLPASVKSRANANRGDVEGLIDHIRAIASVVVAAMFEEAEDGTIRVSLRSKSPKIDVNEIAQVFNGGGHAEAAGATLDLGLETAKERVLQEIDRRMAGLDS